MVLAAMTGSELVLAAVVTTTTEAVDAGGSDFERWR